MTRATRTAMWILVAAMAAAPSLATAAQACEACCCPPSPCQDTPGGCDAAFAPAPCGDRASAAVPTSAKRTPEPSFQVALPAAPRPAALRSGAGIRAGSGDRFAHVSALRLSVVLRL